MTLKIRRCYGPDFNKGLWETLQSLAVVGFEDENKAGEVFREILQRGIEVYVLLIEERVVSAATLFVEPKFIHCGGKVGHIEDVATHKDFQGQGLGSKLVRHLIERARDRGCYKVLLDCSEENVPFYERLGFRRHEVGMRMDFPSPTPRLNNRGDTARAASRTCAIHCKSTSKKQTKTTKQTNGLIHETDQHIHQTKGKDSNQGPGTLGNGPRRLEEGNGIRKPAGKRRKAKKDVSQ